MSGHSQFKNIMHRKGAQDKVRARTFSKLGREITVAAKSGLPDPAYNPRLRAAIAAARAENMPKDNIKRAIEKAEAGDDTNYSEIRYEGFGPGNVAVIVEALTDNPKRTAPIVRSIFGKAGCVMGETGSVAFNFQKIGLIEYPSSVAEADAMFEAALEAGADDVESDETNHRIICVPDDLGAVREALEAKFDTPTVCRFDWKPLVETEITDVDVAKKFFDFVEMLNDEEDIQRVATNVSVSDEIMEKIEE
ncbi:MAG: YebC/PmpR family DNA-binding transcriptional regulator [Alphaproteobacteria bacterium]|nr:YebC/PmpR family DNA-binding transcriptional regulator [Alphaproteobacteria bacterium]